MVNNDIKEELLIIKNIHYNLLLFDIIISYNHILFI